MEECVVYRNLIDALLDGELSGDEAEALRTHLDACPACRRVYDAYKALSETLSEDLAEPPPQLKSGVMLRIAAQKERRLRSRLPLRLAALAACLALVIFAGTRLDLLPRRSSGAAMERGTEEYAASRYASAADSTEGDQSLMMAPAPEAAGSADGSDGVSIQQAQPGFGKYGAAGDFSHVAVRKGDDLLLDSEDPDLLTDVATMLQAPGTAAAEAPDRAPDYLLELTEKAESSRLLRLFLEGEDLLWSEPSTGETFLSPASARTFLKLLESVAG